MSVNDAAMAIGDGQVVLQRSDGEEDDIACLHRPFARLETIIGDKRQQATDAQVAKRVGLRERWPVSDILSHSGDQADAIDPCRRIFGHACETACRRGFLLRSAGRSRSSRLRRIAGQHVVAQQVKLALEINRIAEARGTGFQPVIASFAQFDAIARLRALIDQAIEDHALPVDRSEPVLKTGQRSRYQPGRRAVRRSRRASRGDRVIGKIDPGNERFVG